SLDPTMRDVHSTECVVRTDLLEVAEGLAQRAMIPDADVVDRRLILPQLRNVEFFFGGVKSHIDLIQTVGRPGQRDILEQERCLQFEFVWFDDQFLKTPRNHLQGGYYNEQIATSPHHADTRPVSPR